MATQSSTTSGLTGTAASLPWHLIPPFKPGETDLSDYGKRLEFLSGIWPQEHLGQLAPRAALLCEGSAFQKTLRIPPEKLKVGDTSGIKLLVTTLGGVWGKTSLEDRYEKFEKAIFGLSQRSDETNESYVARHEIVFEDLVSQNVSFQDIRSYVLLHNSSLLSEDKKRVIIESGGNLQYSKVLSAIKMLGSRFFGELQGQGKSTKLKTYDVNFTDDAEEEAPTSAETLLYSEAGELTDQTIEVFAAENDEDAQIIMQFEENLINMLQEDDEMAILMTTYVEARKRLSEKSRFRGFWSTRSGKGGSGGPKGKSKGGGKRSKSLAERIANSECRICWKKGHWKNECPMRNKEGGKNQVANTMVYDNDTVEEDVIFSADGTTDIQDHCFTALSVVPVVVNEKHDCFVGYGEPTGVSKVRKDHPKAKPFIQNFRNTMSRILHRRSEPCKSHHESLTPPKLTFHAPDNRSGSAECHPTKVSKSFVSMIRSEPIDILFASHGTVGIVDLGASQTVMVCHQQEEFLSQLPREIRDQVQYRPVTMSFRFGNNGTVTCDTAMLVPVGPIWLKIALVPSTTPFLISNNVFRQLHAVIHTAQQKVVFEKLGCEVPLKLSDRKLFVMDLCDMIRSVQTQYPSKRSDKVPSSINDQTVLHTIEENQIKEDQIKESKEQENKQVEAGNKCLTVDHHQSETTRQPDSAQSDRTHPVTSNLVPTDRHVPRTAIPEGESCPENRGEHPGLESMHLRRAPELCGEVWQGQVGTALSPSCPRGSIMGPMVRGPVHQLHQTGPHGVHQVCGHVRREDGNQSRNGLGTKQEGCQEDHPEEQAHSCQTSRVQFECESSSDGRFRGRLGSRDELCECPDREPSPFGSHGPTGGSASASSDVAAADSSADWGSNTLSAVDPSQVATAVLDFTDTGENPKAMKTNWVAKEMWDYLQQKGFLNLKRSTIEQSRSDLLEIYCSSDSQLTKQAEKAGLSADRFGLRQGDLRYKDGRYQLYDILMIKRPENAWLAPSCRAWCKWSQFNAMRSPELAKKVIEARLDEEIHLMLCAAVFEFQCWRKAHTHLEQPVGSEMLYQPELHSLYTKMLWSRCDQCVAGLLVHPETGRPIKKGMQVLTTSKILKGLLDKLRCPGNHDHHQVAGSCQYQGQRMNLSAFTELYTARFAYNIIRSIRASSKVREQPSGSVEDILHSTEDSEPETKRRRLLEKQNRPSNYPEPVNEIPEENKPITMEQIVNEAITVAPRVGKIILEGGHLFEMISQYFTDKPIRVIELCKGTDKYRKPPIRLVKGEAPFRRSFGMHRLQQSVFGEQSRFRKDWCKT